MSDAQQSPPENALSFERAEFEGEAAAQLACTFCRKPLTSQYWQISTRPACEQCRATVQREVAASLSMPKLFRALGYGLAAAVVGCVGWIIVTKVTGYEIGFVAIGIGYLVGKAVRKGAGGFGGTRYQVMAVLLTYAAIAFASLPALFSGIAHSHGAHAGAAAVQTSPSSGSVLGLLWALILVFGIAFASPFLQGAENLLGLVIIAIGLYEAWKFTRAIPIQILGPFSMNPQAAAATPLALGTHAAD